MSDVWKVEENDGIVIAAHENPPMNYFVGASDWVREHGAWPEPGSATGA